MGAGGCGGERAAGGAEGSAPGESEGASQDRDHDGVQAELDRRHVGLQCQSQSADWVGFGGKVSRRGAHTQGAGSENEGGLIAHLVTNVIERVPLISSMARTKFEAATACATGWNWPGRGRSVQTGQISGSSGPQPVLSLARPFSLQPPPSASAGAENMRVLFYNGKKK